MALSHQLPRADQILQHWDGAVSSIKTPVTRELGRGVGGVATGTLFAWLSTGHS